MQNSIMFPYAACRIRLRSGCRRNCRLAPGRGGMPIRTGKTNRQRSRPCGPGKPADGRGAPRGRVARARRVWVVGPPAQSQGKSRGAGRPVQATACRGRPAGTKLVSSLRPAGAVCPAGAAPACHRQRLLPPAAVRAANHPGAREQLLQLCTMAGRALGGARRRNEGLELMIARTAAILEDRHASIVAGTLRLQAPTMAGGALTAFRRVSCGLCYASAGATPTCCRRASRDRADVVRHLD